MPMSSEHSVPARGYAGVALAAVFSTASEMMLKQGANDTAHLATPELGWLGVTALHSGWVWLGMLMQVLGFASYAGALRTLPLYVAFNCMSVLHVTIPLCSWYFFREQISLARWAGIALVLTGVWVIARPASIAEERSE